MLPREHGSWALLVVPPLLGLAAARCAFCAEGGLFLLGSLGVFLLRVPLQAAFSPARGKDPVGWLVGYGALATAGFLPLLLVWRRWWLLAFAVPAAAAMASNIRSNLARRTFSLGNELTGILATLLGAPAAFYAASGALDARAWWLWVLNALFFVGPVFHVKTAARQHRALNDPAQLEPLRRMARTSVAYHAAAAAAGLALAILGAVPAIAAAPLGVSLAKAGYRASKGPCKVSFTSLGFGEVGYSALFLLLGAIGYYNG